MDRAGRMSGGRKDTEWGLSQQFCRISERVDVGTRDEFRFQLGSRHIWLLPPHTQGRTRAPTARQYEGPGGARRPQRRCKGPPGHWALFQALEVAPRSSSRVTTLSTKTGHQDGPSPRPRYSSASRTVVSDFAAQSCAPLSHRLFQKLADTASVQELCGIRPSHQCREGSNPRLTVETRDSF